MVFARRLLRDLGYGTAKARQALDLQRGARSITDLRTIDMYEEATRQSEPLPERQGNWVQEFNSDEDALLFTAAQFSRYQEVERFLMENLNDPARVRSELGLRERGLP